MARKGVRGWKLSAHYGLFNYVTPLTNGNEILSVKSSQQAFLSGNILSSTK